MTKKKPPSAERRELRRQAQERPGRAPPKKLGQRARDLPEGDARRLTQELELHKVELELQNEELRAAQVAIEMGMRRYRELFEFAPLGYAVLGPDERIREINHVGAQLLGRDRSSAVGARFEHFIVAAQRTAFSMLIGRARDSEQREAAELDLWLRGAQPVGFALSAVALTTFGPTAAVW